MRTRSAFTLIELLIVVAIIAILAAIAVPNFLEAQTRAKVSRVKSDMRSIATAIEAYSVDWNWYPFPTLRGINYPNTPATRPLDAVEQTGVINDTMTTPVAYLTSLPIDTFKLGGFGATMVVPIAPDSPFARFNYTQRRAGIATGDPGRFWTVDPGPVEIATYRPEWTNAQWILASLGPDRLEDILNSFSPILAEYDPTNGTISRGDITRSSGGSQR
jgi:prepilin-type N-terminal cleavage/methylation domain-containing protein